MNALFSRLQWLLDWFLLPLLALLTVSILAVSAELSARALFPVAENGIENCFEKNDPSGNAPPKPNSVCSERLAEGTSLAEYKFNACGHRAGMQCGPKAPGSYRIVMIGSSFAMGLFTPREKTFAALLPAELSTQAGRPIELYNEARGGKFRGGPFPLPDSAAHFKEVLAAQPDMILWVITPMDLENASAEDPAQVANAPVKSVVSTESEPKPSANLWNKLTGSIADGTLESRLRNRWEQTRSSLVLKHLLLTNESPDEYVSSYVKNVDNAAFLKTQPSLTWQRSLRNFQNVAAQFESQAKAAGVPLLAVLVPNRVQAAMISAGEWPSGLDPYKVDEDLRSMVESSGGTYIDILPELRKIADPEKHYFPVDGHLDASGHQMIASLLAKKLAAVPDLRPAGKSLAALEKSR